jgi:hypothetical protein
VKPAQRIAAAKAWAADRRARHEVEAGGQEPPPPRHPGHKPTKEQVLAARRMIEQHSHDVANLSRPAFAAMLPILEQAKHEVARDLTRWLASHKDDGAERYTALKLSSQLVALRSSLATVAQLGPQMGSVLGDVRVDSAKLSTTHLVNEIARLSSLFDGVDFRPRVNLAAIIAAGERFLLANHKSSAARYGASVLADIKAELAKGMLLQETVQQMTDRLVRIGGPRGYVVTRGTAGTPDADGQYIAEGLFKRYRWWAERIVRDQVAATYTFNALCGYIEAQRIIPDLQKRWDASVDRRTCRQCAMLDGTVVPLYAMFPGGVDGAPLHSCCRCRTGAWREHWSEYMRWADELVAKDAG